MFSSCSFSARFLPVGKLTFLRRAVDFWVCFLVLTLLFVRVVDDFFEMSECSLCKRQKRSEDRDNEREKKGSV